MKIRSPWLIRTIALFGAWILRWWISTLRLRTTCLDEKVHPLDPGKERCIYAFWHESILFLANFHHVKVHVLISQHADGELIARICHHLGMGTVRGSATRGGLEALLELQRCSRQAHLAFTPDGPRGPRRQVHRGLILLASLTGLPIVPVGVGCARAWRLNSWDRFAIPPVGAIAHMVVGSAIHIPPRIKSRHLDHYRQLVEQQMLATTEHAEQLSQRQRPTAQQVNPPTRAA